MKESMSGTVFALHPGSVPLLVSLPHVGIDIPEEMRKNFMPRALATEDTDWHLDKLYDFVREMGASLIVPKFSRYVIDLNRPPENMPMYPGTNNTELCPTRFFTGDGLYRQGLAPDKAEISRRLASFWRPYHDALRAELQRLKSIHGYVILFDGHSIKSELPWLFEGRLPDLNLGTVNGQSCAVSLRAALANVLRSQSQYSEVVDARFKGGYITRHYGRPEDRVHAVQLEICWRCYMLESAPFLYDETLAVLVDPILKALIQTLVHWQPGDKRDV